MVKHKFQLLILLLLKVTWSHCSEISSVQKAYNEGVKAYTEERWSVCVQQFEESLRLYKLYKSAVENCRLTCNSQSRQTFRTENTENIQNLQIYEKFFHIKMCLTNCRREESHRDSQVDNNIEDNVIQNIKARKPYEYLHSCYFHVNDSLKAATAAHTYLIRHPGDENMIGNLNLYLRHTSADPKDLLDLQNDDYPVLYRRGLLAYRLFNWTESLSNMEQAITDYLRSENKCRVQCEDLPEQKWSKEFSITISNNFALLLHCQQQCQDRLKQLKFNSGSDFFADILSHMLMCYYHLDRIDDAAKAIETYLMLFPNDEDMLDKRQTYSAIADANSFVQRSDIENYYNRDEYEKHLLYLFHTPNIV